MSTRQLYFIILSVVILFSHQSTATTYLPVLIETRITEWNYDVSDTQDGNFTYFTLNVTGEVWNKDTDTLEVGQDEYIPSIGVIGIFENTSLFVQIQKIGTWYNTSGITLSDIGYFDLEPGLHTSEISVQLRINQHGLTYLPDSNFTLTYDYSYDDDVRHQTLITTLNNNSNTVYPDVSYDWGRTYSEVESGVNSLLGLSLIALLIFPSLIRKYQYFTKE